MAIKLNITSKELVDKVFKATPRGYDPFEVDSYLDKILKDYRTIESNYLVEKREIDQLKGTIKRLEEEKKELELEIARCENKLQGLKDINGVTPENIDLLKRINVYEKYIYQKMGINPKTLK